MRVVPGEDYGEVYAQQWNSAVHKVYVVEHQCLQETKQQQQEYAYYLLFPHLVILFRESRATSERRARSNMVESFMTQTSRRLAKSVERWTFNR